MLHEGSRFTISSQDQLHSLGPFTLEHKPNGHVCLRHDDAAFLRTHGNGRVDFDGGGGPWAQYQLDEYPAEGGISLLSVGLLQHKDCSVYVGVSAATEVCGVSEPYLWSVDIVGRAEGYRDRPSAMVEGARLVLVSLHDPNHKFGPWTVKHAPKGCVRLEHGGAALVLTGQFKAQLSEDCPKGPRAQFYLEEVGEAGSGIYTVCNLAHSCFLASLDGRLVGHTSNTSIAHFTLVLGDTLLPQDSASPLGGPRRLDWDDSFVLSESQKKHFVEFGFIKLDQIVPQPLISAALRAINTALCCEGAIGQNPNTGGVQYCEGVGGSAAIQDLMYATPAWTAVQQLLGRGRAKKVNGAQIALRPPQEGMDSRNMPEFTPGHQWHIDGMGQGKHSPFTLLVGFTLSAVPEVNMGNFTLFPGSHKILQPLVKEQVRQKSGLFSNENAEGKPDIGLGKQVIAQAGDVVMCHQKLAHRGGPNGSDGIRYQVYFRVKHVDHEAYLDSGAVLEDLWLEFEGLDPK